MVVAVVAGDGVSDVGAGDDASTAGASDELSAAAPDPGVANNDVCPFGESFCVCKWKLLARKVLASLPVSASKERTEHVSIPT